mgnify:FL=1
MNGREDKQGTPVETNEMDGAIESLDDIKDDADGDVDVEEFDTEGVVKEPDKTQGGDSAPVPSGEDVGATGWDKERQRADQAEANLRKTQQERDTLTGKVDATNE